MTISYQILTQFYINYVVIVISYIKCNYYTSHFELYQHFRYLPMTALLHVFFAMLHCFSRLWCSPASDKMFKHATIVSCPKSEPCCWLSFVEMVLFGGLLKLAVWFELRLSVEDCSLA